MAEPTAKSTPIPNPVSAPRMIFVNKREAGVDPLGFMVHKQSGSLVQSNAREVEDEFHGVNDVRDPTNAIIHPTFDFRGLSTIAWQSSILVPLIEAMEVNIDGTRAEIISIPPEEVDEDKNVNTAPRQETAQERRQRAGIQAFFDEPWPGESFLSIRRKLRRDIEELGNGYLEVIRNIKDEVVFARWIDAKTIRLIRLDQPIEVEKAVIRDGSEMKLTVAVRERRYVQTIGGKFVYFKEFGATRDLDKGLGLWVTDDRIEAADNGRLAPERRSTELIHFVNKKDPESPYGLPRWISNAPSVVGARKAEEFNLDFFDSGGVPPLLLIVQGGRIAEDAEKALRSNFLTTGVARHQAAILEAFSTEGSIESPQSVRVTVERFGSERQKDSMFENYVARSEGRIERSFRLPPLFLGATQDFNFATAFASYTVAEAQVFRPERDEFDEVINLKLMPELPNGDKFMYRSLPVIAAGADKQLEAIALVKDLASPEEILEEVNQIANMSLKRMSEDDMERFHPLPPIAGPSVGVDVKPGKGPTVPQNSPTGKNQDRSVEKDRPRPSDGDPRRRRIRNAELNGLQVMAEDIAKQMNAGFRDESEIPKFQARLDEIASLHPAQVDTFQAYLAHELFPHKVDDPEGAIALSEALLRTAAKRYGR